MKRNVDLLNGPIFSSLAKLALPIMATSFVQMAYNMIDMIWIGRIGSGAVAAVGAAGMYMWFSNGIAVMPRIGGQVKVGHSLGASEQDSAISYVQNALQLAIITGLIYGLIALIFTGPLMGFFRLHSQEVIRQGEQYLRITCGLVFFSFINQVMTGITTAMGNSRISFIATAAGLIMNMLLDPVLIFGIGPFPALGVAGAAIATVAAQILVTAIFCFYAIKDAELLRRVHLLQKPSSTYTKQIIRIGFPAAIQSIFFTSISMILSRIVAAYGDAAIAVQRIGSQIESISWVTAEGFGTAVNSFLAQNLGGRNKKRIQSGYRISMFITFTWGLLCSFVLILFPKPIFQLFIKEQQLLPMGISYLQILGISQVFMCMELTTSGAFAGLGQTVTPSLVSIVLTGARIPLALLLSTTILGLDGIWWSVSVSSILKGVVLYLCFHYYLKHRLKLKISPNA